MDELIAELSGQKIKGVTLLPYYTDRPWPKQLRIETEEGTLALFSVEGATVRRADCSGGFDENIPAAEQAV